jgi:hypothetical protein
MQKDFSMTATLEAPALSENEATFLRDGLDPKIAPGANDERIGFAVREFRRLFRTVEPDEMRLMLAKAWGEKPPKFKPSRRFWQ